MNVTLEACMELLLEGTYKEDIEFIVDNFIAVDMDSRTADDIMRNLWKTPSNWLAKTDDGYNTAGMIIYNKMNDEYVASIISDNGDIKKHINKNYVSNTSVNKILKKCEEKLNTKIKYSRNVARQKRSERAAAGVALTLGTLMAISNTNSGSYSHKSTYSTSYGGNKSTTTITY